jgi:hypothetical protein
VIGRGFVRVDDRGKADRNGLADRYELFIGSPNQYFAPNQDAQGDEKSLVLRTPAGFTGGAVVVVPPLRVSDEVDRPVRELEEATQLMGFA